MSSIPTCAQLNQPETVFMSVVELQQVGLTELTGPGNFNEGCAVGCQDRTDPSQQDLRVAADTDIAVGQQH